MASGPQPAVEGSSPGTTSPPSPAAPPPASDGGTPRPAPTRRPVDAANGGPLGAARARPASPRGFSPGRPGSGRAVAPLPVGRAVPPDGRSDRRRADRGPRVVAGRRAHRVVRKIDVWTVLKISLLFYLCVFLVFMIAGIVLWNIAQAFNVIGSVEKFIRSIFDLQKFTFQASSVLEFSALGGGVLVFLATGANVLAALLYNLISDVVGGVQFIVLEEATPAE